MKAQDHRTAELYIQLLSSSLCGDLSDSVVWRHDELMKAIKTDYTGNVHFTLEECRKLLDEADAEYETYLKPHKKSAAEFLGLDAKKVFDFLNWMHPVNSPHTMCGFRNIENVCHCAKTVLFENIPGDFIETGVWKGGLTVLMRGILEAYGDETRTVWVADSFQGLPQPDPSTKLKDAIFWYLMSPIQHLAIPLEYVRGLFRRYHLLDDRVKFLKGWFCDTLPKANIEKLSIIRMDGDLYESTMDALTNLYPKLSPGGFLIVDDYNLPCGCREAVDEYRTAHSITEPFTEITGDSVYWRKC